jgi:hypothetical protein
MKTAEEVAAMSYLDKALYIAETLTLVNRENIELRQELAAAKRESSATLIRALEPVIAIIDEASKGTEDPDADVRFGYDGEKTGYLRWGYKFELRDAMVALTTAAKRQIEALRAKGKK